jgi:hypothetical protein
VTDRIQAIDPTKNVLDLVEAAIRRIDDLSDAAVKRLDERIDALVGRIAAEADKSTALRAQREAYETRIGNLQADYQKQIASILERQTDKSASVLADQVKNATERLAVVEKNQYTSGGQAQVRDPAISNEIAKMTATLEVLSKAGTRIEGATTQKAEARDDSRYLFMIFGTIIGLAGIAAGFLH